MLLSFIMRKRFFECLMEALKGAGELEIIKEAWDKILVFHTSG